MKNVFQLIFQKMTLGCIPTEHCQEDRLRPAPPSPAKDPAMSSTAKAEVEAASKRAAQLFKRQLEDRSLGCYRRVNGLLVHEFKAHKKISQGERRALREYQRGRLHGYQIHSEADEAGEADWPMHTSENDISSKIQLDWHADQWLLDASAAPSASDLFKVRAPLKMKWIHYLAEEAMGNTCLAQQSGDLVQAPAQKIFSFDERRDFLASWPPFEKFLDKHYQAAISKSTRFLVSQYHAMLEGSGKRPCTDLHPSMVPALRTMVQSKFCDDAAIDQHAKKICKQYFTSLMMQEAGIE
jgi:hypothetical protein